MIVDARCTRKEEAQKTPEEWWASEACSSFLERMMKIHFATALAAAGLMAACQPANEQASPKDATPVAAPAATAPVSASALEPTGPAQDPGQRGAESVSPMSPSRSEAPTRRSSQTPPASQPQPAPMPGHDMSTMPDMPAMDHSPN